jgi:hypothetical protein
MSEPEICTHHDRGRPQLTGQNPLGEIPGVGLSNLPVKPKHQDAIGTAGGKEHDPFIRLG